MPNFQDFLEYSDQAELLHRGLQGLEDLSIDVSGASFAGLNTLSRIIENGLLWRELEENLAQPIWLSLVKNEGE